MTASPLNYTGVSIRSIRKPRRAGETQHPEKRRAISEIYPRFTETGMTDPYENPCPAATTEPSANTPPSRPGANYRPRKSTLVDQAAPGPALPAPGSALWGTRPARPPGAPAPSQPLAAMLT